MHRFNFGFCIAHAEGQTLPQLHDVFPDVD